VRAIPVTHRLHFGALAQCLLEAAPAALKGKVNSVSENQFAKLTVKLWRLHQQYAKQRRPFLKAARRGDVKLFAALSKPINKTLDEITTVLNQLVPNTEVKVTR
jgi:hypothetical protein